MEVEKRPILPLEIVGVISRLIDDKATLKNFLLCNGQYLDFCRSDYLSRIAGFNEEEDASLVYVHATDLEAIKALFVWDLRPRASYAVYLRVTCLSTEIPVLTSFLTTRIQGDRLFRDVKITIRPRDTLDIVPLLQSVVKIGAIHFSMQRCLQDYAQPSKVISLQTFTYNFQKLLVHSSITDLQLADVDLSPPEIQNLLRFSLSSLNITTLALSRCGKHHILAGLQMPFLQNFDISIDYGQGGILSFVSHHPTLKYLGISGTPDKMVDPLLPSRPRLPNLIGLVASLRIAEQLFKRESCPQLRCLSIHSDVDAANKEDVDPIQNQYVADYAQRIFNLA